MVFRRISTGCGECRLQHTKCDGVVPSCGRCRRRNITCPGYRHVGGFVFKSQNVVDVRKSAQQSQRTASHLPQSVCYLGTRNTDHFIAFFFNTYVLAGPRDDAGCGLGLPDHLLTLYHRTSPKSSLAQAATLVGATTFILTHGMDRHDFSKYHEIRHGAIKSLRQDVQCKSALLRDDTLMAVLLLDLTEVIIRAHTGLYIPLSHQYGTLALLKLRGTLNFETEQARSLYNAAKLATLRGPTRPAEMVSTLQALDLIAQLEKHDQAPALQLLDVLEKIVELQCAMEAAISQGQSLSHLHVSALDIQESLDAWTIALPAAWLPRIAVFQTHASSTATSTLVEYYAHVDIAVMFNLWRCACLKLLRLLGVFRDYDAIPSPLRLQSPFAKEIQGIFDGVCRAVPNFLGLLQGSHYVEQDAGTGAWMALCPAGTDHHIQQRFTGDNLSKWYLSDLLERLQQAIGNENDLIPPLPVSQESVLFLREQKRILSNFSPPTTQLAQVFTTL